MPLVNVIDRLGRPPAVSALEGEDAVYVVGGAVRDVLLGRTPHELDFVVEGDAVAVARRAAERLGGRVTVHDRFGTATVEAPDATFDLAGARRERYERPGALPDVELGASLRRGPRAPRLHGQRDRAAPRRRRADLLSRARARTWTRGVLRVLHDRSFLDDPTRLLRLARYGARLGFEPDPETDRLAAAAIAGGALDTVTGSRLGAELRLLLREPQPAALLALERHGLGRALLGDDFAVDGEVVAPRTGAGAARRARRSGGAGSPPDGSADSRRGSTTSRSRPASATSSPRRRSPSPRRHDRRGAVAGAAQGARRRRWRWRARAARTRRRADGSTDVRHRRLAIDGQRPRRRRSRTGRRSAQRSTRAMEAMLDGRAPGRDEQLAAALGA